VDTESLAARLLRYQYPNGAIRNFIGYDHPDNGRRRGRTIDCWEDVYPTPNWNAQAFHFLCRVLPPPEPPIPPKRNGTFVRSSRYIYVETSKCSVIVGIHPFSRGIIAVYVKRLRYGLVIPGAHMLLRGAVKVLINFRLGRTTLRWLRRWTGRGPQSFPAP
jgi:hypothetical protein